MSEEIWNQGQLRYLGSKVIDMVLDTHILQSGQVFHLDIRVLKFAKIWQQVIDSSYTEDWIVVQDLIRHTTHQVKAVKSLYPQQNYRDTLKY